MDKDAEQNARLAGLIDQWMQARQADMAEQVTRIYGPDGAAEG